MEQWNGFLGSTWREHIDVANFIKENYTEYTGDESFLIGPSQKTNSLYSTLKPLLKEELENIKYVDDSEKIFVTFILLYFTKAQDAMPDAERVYEKTAGPMGPAV